MALNKQEIIVFLESSLSIVASKSMVLIYLVFVARYFFLMSLNKPPLSKEATMYGSYYFGGSKSWTTQTASYLR